ncbi:MAG: hypothetical protein PVJ80_03310 [Gemmatimonadota bacterium]
MSSVVRLGRPTKVEVDLSVVPREVTEEDTQIYRDLVSTELTPEQIKQIEEPPRTYERQREVLAVHWHQEFVPLQHVRTRVRKLFPNRETELIIPTQHNVLSTWDGYTGVEVDCYSAGFNRKVQFLIHFSNERIEGKGDVFRAMLDHTFKYRSSQLFEFLDTLQNPRFQERVDEAAAATWTDEDTVEFARIHAARLQEMIEQGFRVTPPEMIKNKLLRNYMDRWRETYGDPLVDHVQVFLKALKGIVKRNFALDYFYRSEEVIEEVRALGGCIVIPHPEQFWPVLLDDLDIDGIEVWNPQSFEYTAFLIDVVNRRNSTRQGSDRPVLITMGDDCHMGEKVKEPRHQDPEKAGREIGVQPPWDDLNIRKPLIVAKADRANLIREYRARLA